MCCGNKKKPIDQPKSNVKPPVVVPPQQPSVSAIVGNPGTASNLRSKLPIDKKLQKSSVKIQEIQDPRIVNFFTNCRTQRIQLNKVTNQHNSYVRQYDYFDLSNGHQAELRNLGNLPDTRGAMYNVSDSSTLSTPTVNRFCYDRNITDVSYIPKATQYRSFNQHSTGNLPQISRANQEHYMTNTNANQNPQGEAVFYNPSAF